MNIVAAFAHNSLAVLAGSALSLLANHLQTMTHTSVLSHSAALALSIIAGAVTRDALKTVPAFARSSGTIATKGGFC